MTTTSVTNYNHIIESYGDTKENMTAALTKHPHAVNADIINKEALASHHPPVTTKLTDGLLI